MIRVFVSLLLALSALLAPSAVAGCPVSPTAGYHCFILACDYTRYAPPWTAGAGHIIRFPPNNDARFQGRLYAEVELQGAFPVGSAVPPNCQVFDRRAADPFGSDLVRLDLVPRVPVLVPQPITITHYLSQLEHQNFVNGMAYGIRDFAPVFLAIVAIMALLAILRK